MEQPIMQTMPADFEVDGTINDTINALGRHADVEGPFLLTTDDPTMLEVSVVGNSLFFKGLGVPGQVGATLRVDADTLPGDNEVQYIEQRFLFTLLPVRAVGFSVSLGTPHPQTTPVLENPPLTPPPGDSGGVEKPAEPVAKGLEDPTGGIA
jgi:hypothetical protein